MLNKVSSFLSIKETEFFLFSYAKIFRIIGGLFRPEIAKYFLLMTEAMTDEEVIRASRKFASLGLVRKRLLYWAYLLSKLLSPELNKHIEKLGLKEYIEFNKTINKRIDKINHKYFKIRARDKDVQITRDQIKEILERLRCNKINQRDN